MKSMKHAMRNYKVHTVNVNYINEYLYVHLLYVYKCAKISIYYIYIGIYYFNILHTVRVYVSVSCTGIHAYNQSM